MDNREEEFEEFILTQAKKNDQVQPQTFKYGIISIVVAIVGIFFMGKLLGLAAIVCAIIALKKRNENKILPIIAILIGVFDIITIISVTVSS